MLTRESVSVVARGGPPHPDGNRRAKGPATVVPRVVSLWGEHDRASAGELTALLQEVIALDDGDLAIDLSEVTFMDASTIGVFVVTGRGLGETGRRLSLRSPSALAGRILAICGLCNLVEAAEEPASAATRAS